MIDAQLVIAIHEAILQHEDGLKEWADLGKLGGALSSIDNWMLYENTDNIFDIATLYSVAVAKAHAFPDGNKRAAMMVMLTYLDLQGVAIVPNHGLDDIMVDVDADNWISGNYRCCYSVCRLPETLSNPLVNCTPKNWTPFQLYEVQFFMAQTNFN